MSKVPLHRRHHCQLLAVAVFALLVITSLWWNTLATTSTVPVLKVIDGDTIDVLYERQKDRVRFLCVNTEESVHPDRKQNTEFGRKTSKYVKEHLSGKRVTLEFEGVRKRGNYGRLLAYVFLDGENINLRLVREGWSAYYTKYGRSIRYDKEFQEAEQTARREKLGIWATGESTQKYLRLKSKWGQRISKAPDIPDTPSAPSEGGVQIVRIEANPAGDDRKNLNGEFVELKATSHTNLSGWILSDKAGHSYLFPETILKPDDTVKVHTGSGTDTGTDLYWGSKSPIWNNNGDVATLYDSAGKVVARKSY